jgi:hypothetical protein
MQLRFTWALALTLGLVGLTACGSDDPKEDPMPNDKCELDSECADTPGTPYCGGAGVCVACEENAQCSGATPVCELASNTCRACSADSECGSGVCLATLGTCALPEQLVYVKQDGVDTGTCEAGAPCATLNYAKNRATATRNVIRVIGNLTQTAELQTKLYVDGDGGTWTAPAANVSALTVGTSAGDVTIEGLTLQGTTIASTAAVIDCLNLASLRLHQATVKQGTPGIFSVCKLHLSDSTISDVRNAVTCMDSALFFERSKIGTSDDSAIKATNCEVKLLRNEITGNPGPRFLVDVASPAMLTVENNLLWDRMALTSSGLSVTNAPTGGTIRFNTLVNTSPGAHNGNGVSCVGTSQVSSNVIAWQAGNAAVVPNACARRYNAYDSLTSVGVGEGNTSAAMATLFLDPAGDFHLGASSPALGLADPDDKVAVDLDGKARPTSGRLDAGAYETP